MSQFEIPKTDLRNTKKQFLVDSRLRICIECGCSLIDHHEFGISCEICGTLLLFNPSRPKKKWRELGK